VYALYNVMSSSRVRIWVFFISLFGLTCLFCATSGWPYNWERRRNYKEYASFYWSTNSGFYL